MCERHLSTECDIYSFTHLLFTQLFNYSITHLLFTQLLIYSFTQLLNFPPHPPPHPHPHPPPPPHPTARSSPGARGFGREGLRASQKYNVNQLNAKIIQSGVITDIKQS